MDFFSNSKPDDSQVENKEKTLQTRQSTEVAMFNFEDEAGGGGEDVTANDLQRMALRIGQALSPYCDTESEKYIKGFKPGMLINTATLETWQGNLEKEENAGVMVLPVKYLNREIEWKPNREGFVAEHLIGSDITNGIRVQEIDGKQIRVTKNGTYLVDTSIFHCLLFNHIENNTYGWEEVIIDMSVSNKQTAKLWLAYLRGPEFKRVKSDGSGNTYQLPFYSAIFRMYSKYKAEPKPHFIWKFQHAANSVENKIFLEINPRKGVSEQTVSEHRRIYTAAIEHKKLIEAGKIVRNYQEDFDDNNDQNSTTQNNNDSVFVQ